MKTSEFKGFYKLSPQQRLEEVAKFSSLTEEEVSLLAKTGALSIEAADHMIENVFSVMPLPMGIAVNFTINGKDYLIPMAVEEPSVVAAASNAARMARVKGGFFTSNTGPIMRAQIQIVNVADPYAARFKLFEAREKLIEIANSQDPMLISLGGGMKDLEVQIVPSPLGTMVVMHLIADTRDAMGANTVNTMAEALAPYIEQITGGKVYLRILSNLADKRLVRVRTVIDKETVGGEAVVDGIVWAYTFASVDPYRAATHNKGIMNGIIPAVTATGNDTRAIEAGAHAYAARNGRYTSLTVWEKNKDGDLVGTIEVPMAVGLVGGATKVHPVARLAVKILDVKSAVELGEVIAAVGLAQNLTALKALATEGIQRGHMSLHARNVAVAAGATPDIIDQVVAEMVKARKVRQDYAEELVKQVKK
ncbi:3-hydroxy-3-methylglutaryl-coenzyme A reductase [Anaerospora hongkongensis]|uniref:3-hydroxy-3-methylglutaryl coenzyme A reductase n=1 Tax=Anaerospora hongkongensis TaxID=244830 RepID=A0A4R1Q051_9FIRM|nr:hydroxymethylglutaryl-CoA reductase, degradative [Anaerospora hongkongensis]TCL37353.1 3-hydroxy-3-methylglutaryl-coenzyme A reductase [Anaerospora hongkongensis]